MGRVGERWSMGHKTVPFRSTEHLSEEAISVYVDGVMPNYVRMRAEQHLRQCPECRALVEQQRQARARLNRRIDLSVLHTH